MHSQSNLLHIVDTLHPPGRLACRLHGGQEQGDQDRNDRNDHEQFDQRETLTLKRGHGCLL